MFLPWSASCSLQAWFSVSWKCWKASVHSEDIWVRLYAPDGPGFGSFPIISGVIQQNLHLWFWPGVRKLYQIRLLYGINLCSFSGIRGKAGMHQEELDAALTDKYSSLFNYVIPMLIKQQIWMTRKTCRIGLTVETYWLTCFSIARKLGCQFTAVILLKQLWWKGQKTVSAHLTSAQKAVSDRSHTVKIISGRKPTVI